MNIAELIEEVLNKSNRFSQVGLITTFILEAHDITSPETAISGAEIYREYCELRQQDSNLIDIPQNTFNVVLSQLAESEESNINCLGKKQGYYIDKIFYSVDAKGSEEKENTRTPRPISIEPSQLSTLSEKDMYPFLENWLLKEGHERVADISSKRGLGKWSNPDIVGFKIDNIFGSTHVEITTIEAKTTYENWEQWIFEAVAHTVFSNRSYFAFIHPTEYLNKLSSDLKHYAEIFNVGIILILVSLDDYVKIQNKQPFILSNENHVIAEYTRAPFNTPHVRLKKRFLHALEITEPKHLYTFGKTIA